MRFDLYNDNGIIEAFYCVLNQFGSDLALELTTLVSCPSNCPSEDGTHYSLGLKV